MNRTEVLINRYGAISEQDVANMNAQDVVELGVFVDSQLNKAQDKAIIKQERLQNKTATGRTRIIYRDAPMGKVDMLISMIGHGDVTILMGMTKTDMLSKATRLNAKTRHVTRAEFKAYEGLNNG